MLRLEAEAWKALEELKEKYGKISLRLAFEPEGPSLEILRGWVCLSGYRFT